METQIITGPKNNNSNKDQQLRSSGRREKEKEEEGRRTEVEEEEEEKGEHKTYDLWKRKHILIVGEKKIEKENDDISPSSFHRILSLVSVFFAFFLFSLSLLLLFYLPIFFYLSHH